jgi:hypothetical protein
MDAVNEQCPPLTMFNLVTTCKTLYPYRNFIFSRKIRQLLHRYFQNLDRFRHQLAVTDSVVSGSSVLHVMAHEPSWIPKDLDLYVPFGSSEQMSLFLTTEGYESETSRFTDWTKYAAGVHSVTKFRRECDGAEIDLVESSFSCVINSIVRFHSTCVMNFITCDRIVSLYPRLTLRNLAVIQDGVAWRTTRWKPMYERRNIDFVSISSIQEHHIPTFGIRVRTLGDQDTLVCGYGSEMVTGSGKQFVENPCGSEGPFMWEWDSYSAVTTNYDCSTPSED